jgi:hypothetical protein
MVEQIPPAWLTSMVDQKLALMLDVVPFVGFDVIFMMLTEPTPADDPKKWERSCDNPSCRTYCPEGTDFYTGQVEATAHNDQHGAYRVIIGYGVCSSCAAGFETKP